MGEKDTEDMQADRQNVPTPEATASVDRRPQVKVRAMRAVLVGMAGSTFGGLVGLGGTVVMVPLLTEWLGLNQHEAHATSLLSVILTAVSAGVRYSLSGHVGWLDALAIAAGGIVSAHVGALLSQRTSAARLRRFFGSFIVVVSLSVLIREMWPSTAFDHRSATSLVSLAVGVLSGYLSGFFGVGGGVIMVPALLLAGYPQHVAQGTSLVAMVPMAASGIVAHHRSGSIRWGIVPLLLTGSLMGGYLGATAAHRIPGVTLRVILVVSLIVLGLLYSRPNAR